MQGESLLNQQTRQVRERNGHRRHLPEIIGEGTGNAVDFVEPHVPGFAIAQEIDPRRAGQGKGAKGLPCPMAQIIFLLLAQ